jgi:Ca2+-transporting ATPase
MNNSSSRQNTAPAWHALDIEQTLAALGVKAEQGLSAAESKQRLQLYGLNQLLQVARVTWLQVLLRQFVDVLIIILFIAAVISFAVGDVGDGMTIMAIIVLNGVLGFVQEWKAEQAMAALQRMLSPQCRVLRDGDEQSIDARDLVPGDVVLLAIGDRVPADLRLVTSTNLKIDESALTGESLGVHKDTAAVAQGSPLDTRSNMAWMGTVVTNGHAHGAVVATGMATEFGRIAQLTQTVSDETTPLQRNLAVLGRQLGLFAVAISTLVALSGWLLGKPLLEMFFTGISLAVAVVPEGLPAVVTITLALGIRAMVRRRALLRRLQAAETLGAATIVCTDKTGTLTQNAMTVKQIWLAAGAVQVTGIGYDPSGHFEQDGQEIDYQRRPDLMNLLHTGMVCNHARVYRDERGWQQAGEPTEAALLVAAYKARLDTNADGPQPRITVSEFSFNADRKRMTLIEHRPQGTLANVKGAPEVILERCTQILDGDTVRPLSDSDRQQVSAAYSAMANSGLRTLAIAQRELPAGIGINEEEVECELTLLGIVGIIDPPRPEVPAAIRVAYQAGIRPIMITGDAAATAQAIAQRIGMPVQRTLVGRDLDAMDDAALLAALQQEVLFARTRPEHKLRIVTLLQGMNHVVAMTGDGVNDAPALKKADIGIAMGLRGTDVAKGAADMVLTDDNFASIIGAVEEGRRQYDNIQKFVRYLLSSNTGEIVAIFVNVLLGGPLILLPVQILWMNLVTDGMTAVALGLEPAEKGVMQRPPYSPRAAILDRLGMTYIILLGGYIGVATLWLFHHYLDSGEENALALAQTMAFTGIIVLEKMNVFNYRSLRAPLRVIGFFTNPWVLLAWAFTIGLQLCAVYVPVMQDALHTIALGWQEWLIIFTVALPLFLLTETYKWLWWQRHGQPEMQGTS